MKKTFAATTLALATATSAALAEPAQPVELADDQLDQVTAGVAMGPPPLTLVDCV